MKATKDQRWAAVYGAAYVKAKGSFSFSPPDHWLRVAYETADEALAAEPKEAEPELGGDLECEVSDDVLSIYSKEAGEYVPVTRYEAAALARILSRFAETGEV